MDDQQSLRPFSRLFEVPFARRDPIIVGDTASVEYWASDNGYKFCDINSAATLADADLFVICATSECYKRLNALRQAFASCRVLWMPFAAFHDETGPVDYGLSQLAGADLGYARDKQIAAAGFLSDHRAVRVRDASGNSAEFHVPRSAFIQEAPHELLKPGDFISVISYFEVETEYAAPGCEPVAADGSLTVRCLLHARAASSHSGPDAVAASSQLCTDVASAKNCRLELADGFLSRFIIDGLDVASSVGAMAGERLGRRITEFSIGLNDHLSSPDWSLNSPLNEGAAGVHLGVGDGYSGIHFDFICPFATVEAV